MADREKVEKGIKACWSKYFYHSCCDCPYMIDRNDEKCVEQLGTDVLELLKEQEHKDRMFHALEDDWKRLKELLKEQEAVEPKSIDYVWHCGNCNEFLSSIESHRIHFCSNCGKAVKWDD